MDRRALFPDHYAEGRDQRVDLHWDLRWPAPVPREIPPCPVCPDGRAVAKDWRFHSVAVAGSPRPWRCDVRFKCVDCSAVWQHGVAIPEAMYRHGMSRFGENRTASWRKIREWLEAAGYFDA